MVTFGATSCLSLLGRPFDVLSHAAERKMDFFGPPQLSEPQLSEPQLS